MNTRYVTIDSRDRDWKSSTPSSYTVELAEPIRDVCSVRVRSTNIPPMWSLPRGRSTVWVSTDSGTTFTPVVIAPGHYDASAAASAFESALNDTILGITWSVSVSNTGIFTVSNPTAGFVLRGGDPDADDGYGASSCGRFLGFSRDDAESVHGSNHEVIAPHRHQLDVEDTMYIHIDNYDALIDTGNGRTGGYGALEVVNVYSPGAEHETPATKWFSPPLSKVTKLKIKIVDYYGVLIDFDNKEHRIELVFETRDAKQREGGGYFPPFAS